MISIRESIKFGWRGFKSNWKPFIVLAILLTSVMILTSDKNAFSIKSLLGEIVLSALWLGGVVISLKVADGKKVSLSDFRSSYKDYKLIALFILVNITISVLFQLGMFLLIIPGLIIGARFLPAPFLVVDKNTSYVDTFKRSWELTRGKTIKLILFEIAIFGVVILGFLALIVGVLATFGVISIASAHIYRKLSA